MREKIYTEVATFISMNEARPVYLLNLFKQLQNLRDNQSRYRALKNIYDIGAGLRTDQDDYDDDNDIIISNTNKNNQQNRRISNTSTQSSQKSYQNQAAATRHLYNIKKKYEAISVSTSNTDANDSDYFRGDRDHTDDSVEKKFYYSRDQDDDSSTNRTTTPFESDSLSNTVIFLGSHPNQPNTDIDQNSLRLDLPNVYVAKNINQSSKNQRTSVLESQSSSSSIMGLQSESINAKIGDDVKQMISKVISLIRISDKLESGQRENNTNNDSSDEDEPDSDVLCDASYLNEIVEKVLSVLRCSSRHYDYLRLYQSQLISYLKDALQRYENKRLIDCIEDILIEISDILYNELTFYTIMSEGVCKRVNQKSDQSGGQFQQVTLQDRFKYKRNESTVNHCGSSTSNSSSSSDESTAKKPVTFHMGSQPLSNETTQFGRYKGVELLKRLNSILIEKVDKLTNFDGKFTDKSQVLAEFDDLNKLDCQNVSDKMNTSAIGVKSIGYLKENECSVASSCGDREELDIEVGGSERSSAAASSYDSDSSTKRKDRASSFDNQQSLPYTVVDVNDLEASQTTEIVAPAESTIVNNEAELDKKDFNLDALDKIIMDSISDDLVGDADALPTILPPQEEHQLNEEEKKEEQTSEQVEDRNKSESSTSDHFVIIKDDSGSLVMSRNGTSSSSAGSNSSSEMDVIDMKKEDEKPDEAASNE